MKILSKQHAKELYDSGQLDEFDHEIEQQLYELFEDEMPYGVAKARTEDPANWIAERLASM